MSVYFARSGSDAVDDYAPEREDATLLDGAPSLARNVPLTQDAFDRLFLHPLGLGYVGHYVRRLGCGLRVVSHPRPTNTCFEKAEMLGAWRSLDVIKALYFQHVETGALYAAVVPETGCFLHRPALAKAFGIGEPSLLRKASALPTNMEPGTCSPFIMPSDRSGHGGLVEKILFDSETLVAKQNPDQLDDFSFGRDHRWSIQMSYHHCYRMLAELYPEHVASAELLPLQFTEVFARKQGKLKISYDFASISYRIATFIADIHGSGEITVSNDHVDELELPTFFKPRRR